MSIEHLAAEREALRLSGDGTLRAKLEDIVSLGTYVAEKDDIVRERATMRSAAALLRAVAVALGNEDCDSLATTDLDVRFDAIDAARCCAAIAVLLEHGGDLARELRDTEADDANDEEPTIESEVSS